MKSCRADIERLVPVLRQVARALVDKHRADIADDLVHEALDEALRGERSWTAGEVEARLFTRLIAANRMRLRSSQADERHSLAGSSRAAPPTFPPRTGQGLDSLSLADREALILVVLARLEYTKVADVLGIPIGTLVTRLTHARDALGSTLWAAPAPPPRSRTGASHLRLVKS